MADLTLQSCFYSQVQRVPDRKAITFIQPDGSFEWITFSGLHAIATSVAESFRNHGLRQKQACIIVLPHSMMTAQFFLGANLLGAIPLLIAPPIIHGQKSSYSSLLETLRAVIKKTSPGLVLLSASMRNLWDEVANGFPQTRFVIAEDLQHNPGTHELQIPVLPSDFVAYQLSSGTTGVPKICVWQHQQLMAAIDTNAEGMNLQSDDMQLSWVPLYHDMGLVNNFLTSLAKGIPFAMMDPADFVRKPAFWLRSMFETKATITWSPNFGYSLAASRIKDQELESVTLNHVRGFWNAAERIHLETLVAFHKRFAPYGVTLKALKTNFGCTENIGGATFSDADGMFVAEQVDERVLREKEIAQIVENPSTGQQVVSIVGSGKARGGIRMHILSLKGKELPEGRVGELALESPSRMVGYLRDSKSTRKAIFKNLVRTGDLGYLRNNEFFWVGRVKERITVRGKKLDPSDFERVLLPIERIRPGCFVAFGVDDPAIGTQKIVVITEINDDVVANRDQLILMIRNRIFQTLGVTVDEVFLTSKGTLAKTSSGKRRHQHFRKLYLEGKLTRSFLDAAR